MQTKLVWLFLLTFLLAHLSAQNDVTVRLDALLSEAVAKDVFSGNVLIVKDNKPLHQKSVGMADYEKSLPNTAETQFSIGSITKLFTKIIVLQLVAEGKIGLDNKLSKYLSGFRSDVADRVTVAHLMQHQSGLGQYYEVPNFNPEETTVTSASDFLPWIRQEELLFEPGTQTEYSNSGYIVLAAIIEKVEGKNYAEVLKTRILDKLGMSATGFLFRMENMPGKAVGYLSNMPGPRQDNLNSWLLGGGDGGIYSTLDDLLKLDKSLADDNRLLSDADKLRLFNDPLFPRQYASWQEFRKEGRIALAGGGPGVSAVYGRNNEQNRTVVVLSNYDEGSAEMLFQRIGAILNGQPVEPLQPSPSKFIYNLLNEKGAAYFSANIERELDDNGYALDDDMVLLFAGQAILAEGSADEAVALYRFYTQKFPDIVVAWNDLGDAYLLKNDKENAKKCFQKAIELRPGNERAKASLEKIK
jgi:CubicO group peptidase (beta-lactamase class C family)